MNYGIPYMGSKSKIVDKVCALFPRAENFYDLFGGGFSVTHFMLKHRSKHFKNFHFNEIRPGICDLIKDAIFGKYNYDVYSPPWVSRKEFFEKLDTDPLVKIVWSFGNNGKMYLFGEDIEEYKRSMHMAVVFNEFDETAKEVFGINAFKDGYSINDRRLYLRSRISHTSKGKKRGDIQQLQQLQQLDFYSTSYEKVPIKDGSVIYCDIPYKGTSEYDGNDRFDHKTFFDWAHEMKEPVFISEYNVIDPRFKCIANFEKRSMLSANKDKTLIKTEKVYANHAAYRALFQGRTKI